MHFTSALITLALAASSQVAATSVITATSTNSSGTNLPLLASGSSNAPHSSYMILSSVGNNANAYTYAGAINGTAIPVTTGTGTTASVVAGPLSCSVCNSAIVDTGVSYSWGLTAYTGISASGNTVTGTPTVITEAATLSSGVAKNLGVPVADTNQLQAGKLYTFVVPPSTGTGNVTSATIAITAASNPFSTAYIAGAGVCPIPPATTDNITRVNFTITPVSGASNVALTQTVEKLVPGTFWMYLSPSATKNTLGAPTDTITVTVLPFGNSTCKIGTNGFCSGAATIKSVVGVAFAGAMAAAFMLF